MIDFEPHLGPVKGGGLPHRHSLFQNLESREIWSPCSYLGVFLIGGGEVYYYYYYYYYYIYYYYYYYWY